MAFLKTDFVKMTYENEMLRNTFLQYSHIDLEKAREFIDLNNKLVQNDVFAGITTAQAGVSFSKEARALLAIRVNNIYAAALISDRISIRVIANFFIKINKPDYPTKLFPDEKTALAWIKIKKDQFS